VAFQFGTEKTLFTFLRRIHYSVQRRAFLGAFLVFALVFAGCKRDELAPLPSARIHSITQQLAAAAAATAPGSVIKTKKAASEQQAGSIDEIYLGLGGSSATEDRRAAVTKLLQSLDSVATRNQLTRDTPAQSGNSIVFDLRRSGVPTHRIEIAWNSLPPSNAESHNLSGKPAEARLAVILDDLGSDRAPAEAVFSLHYPLTVSVLPNHEHSVEIAKEANQRGYQVMLHLPMQSVGKEQPESQELRPGMNPQEVAALLDQFLAAVPAVVGVNNHQGSQATADPVLMSELMPALRDRNLFYVDSRTTAETVAFDTAQKDGVRSAFRNVPFLDDVAETAAVRKQLELALKGAREKGEAIAIGHPHPATLQALREILPQAEGQGVHLVFASELVH
jgi:uncharacterized protein